MATTPPRSGARARIRPGRGAMAPAAFAPVFAPALAARPRACAAVPAAGGGAAVRAAGGRLRPLVKTVLPADSDYSGALWHGGYVRWLEEARCAALADAGLEHGDPQLELVAGGVELVVTSLGLKYRKVPRLGEVVEVRARADAGLSSRVRLAIVSEFVRAGDGGEEVLATAEFAITPVSVASGRAMRKWSPELTDAMRRLFGGVDGDGEVPAWLEG